MVCLLDINTTLLFYYQTSYLLYMVELSGFITNLGKYNEGELVGEWVTFPLTDDEYDAVMKKIGAGEPPYEEIFWTDWDCDIDGVTDALGEYISYEEVNELVEKIEAVGNDEKAGAIIETYGIDALDNADDIYYISYSDLDDYNHDRGLGYYIVEENGGIENMGNDTLEMYFDYESFGRDIKLNDYYETSSGFLSHY